MPPYAKHSCMSLKTCSACRFLPEDTEIIGYARSQLTANQLHERVRPFLKGSETAVQEFLSSISYVQGAHGLAI